MQIGTKLPVSSPLPGRLLEASGNRRPREMVVTQGPLPVRGNKTRLTGPLQSIFCFTRDF